NGAVALPRMSVSKMANVFLDVPKHRTFEMKRAAWGILLGGLIGEAVTGWAATVVVENPVSPRPIIVPVPELTMGVAQTVVSITGNWKTISNPEGEFWLDSTNLSGWRDLSSGGRRGGFGGGGAGKSAFRTTLVIPADYAGHRVVLRFDGVSNGA